DHQHGGARDMRGGGEIMAVEPIAADGEERLARLQAARIDRNAGDPGRYPAQRPPLKGLDDLLAGPQIAHPAISRSAVRTSWWSENGRVRSPTVWPSSWPLPATISVSPSARIHTAARIASRRAPISIPPGAPSRNASATLARPS